MIHAPFARDSLGNNAFHLGKEISRQDVARFGHVAFEKIRKELMVRRASVDRLIFCAAAEPHYRPDRTLMRLDTGGPGRT